jgi:hypothetical protein
VAGGIIAKLPPFWRDFATSLKHKRQEFSVAELIGSLDVEERARAKDNRGKGVESSAANMVQKKNSFASYNKKKKNKQENNNTKPKQTAEFNNKNNKKGGGCFVCGSDEHWASVCPDRKYKQEKKSSNMVISETGGGTFGYGNSLPLVLSVCLSPEWWMDRGANIYVCTDISLFTSIQVGGIGGLLMGNGLHARVLGVGMVVLKFTLEKMVLLKNVQLVPSIKKNLVSGSQMYRSGFKIVLESNKCVSRHGTFIGKGYDCGGLFRLSLLDDVYNKVVNNVNVCVQSKQPYKPHKVAEARNLTPLELIHSDLCEMNGELTKGGKRYFMIFIDDCTRFYYVYLLKTKDEALYYFKIYKAEVENQLERKVKQLRSDCGGEYFQMNFLSFTRCMELFMRGCYHTHHSPMGLQRERTAL